MIPDTNFLPMFTCLAYNILNKWIEIEAHLIFIFMSVSICWHVYSSVNEGVGVRIKWLRSELCYSWSESMACTEYS